MVLEKFTEMMTMAEAAQMNAKARKVIEKYFGKSCFQCPSFVGEPLFLGARMHAVNIDALLKELDNTLC